MTVHHQVATALQVLHQPADHLAGTAEAVGHLLVGEAVHHPLRAVGLGLGQALQQGRVLPLRTVLDQVERDYQGQVIKVEFEHDDGRFIYEIRLLQSGGRVAKLKIDARDGKVLSFKRKD